MININNNLLNFLRVLIILIPLSLTTGPFLPDLFLSLTSIIFLFIIFRNKLWEYFDNIYFKFFLALNIYLVISSLISIDPMSSLKTSIFYFRFIIFALATWFVLKNSSIKYQRNYTFIIVIFFIIICLDAFFQYFSGYNALGFKKSDLFRVSGIFQDELVLGSYLSRLFIFIYSLFLFFFTFKKNFNWFLCTLFLCLILCTVIISGERTSFGLIIMSIFSLILFVKLNKRTFLSLIILIPVLLVTFATSDKKIAYRMFVEPLQQSGQISNNLLNKYEDLKKNYTVEKKVIFSREHTLHYIVAYRVFLDNYIFGAGPRMFRQVCSFPGYVEGTCNEVTCDSCSTHPHNVLAQILSETGILGLLFYIVIIVYLLKKIFKLFRKIEINSTDIIKFGCLSVFLINLFPLIPSGNIFNNWISIIFYIPLGFYLYLEDQKRNL